MKFVKKLFKISVFIFLFFLLLVIGGLIALKVMLPPETLRSMIEKEASKFAKRDIRIKDASFSVFPSLGIQIEGLHVTNTRRTNVLQKDETLWSHLKSQNLKKERVKIIHNGQVILEPFEKDVPLKKGDKLSITRLGFKEKEPLLSLERIHIAVKLAPLLTRKIEISNISLQKFNLLIEVNSTGLYNFDDLTSADPKKKKKKDKSTKKEEKTSSQPIQFHLDSFSLEDAKIHYINHNSDQDILLDDIHQTLSVSYLSSAKEVFSKGLFEIRNIALQGKGLPVRKSGFNFVVKHEIQANMKDSTLNIKEFSLGMKKTKISSTGTIKGYDKKEKHFDMEIKTNILKLQDLFQEVPTAMFPDARKMKVRGESKLMISVKGSMLPEKMPPITGSFWIKNGFFQHADLPKALHDLNTDILFTPNKLNIKKASLKLGEDPIALSAKIENFKKPSIDAKLSANIDLSHIKEAVKLPEGYSAKGKIEADISVKGQIDPKHPESLDVDGNLEMINLIAKVPSIKKPINMKGLFSFSNQRIALKKFSSQIGLSSFTMDLIIKDYLNMVFPKQKTPKAVNISYTLNSPLLDFNEIFGIESKTETENQPTKEAESSQTDEDGDKAISIPSLPNIKFWGKLRVKKLVYSTMPLTNGKINLSYYKKKMSFSLNANLFKGKMTEAMTVHLANKNRISIQNRFVAKRIEANDFITRFNAMPDNYMKILSGLKLQNSLYGKLDIDAKANTFGITKNQFKKNLDATIRSKIHKGTFKQATFLSSLFSVLPAPIKKFLPDFKNLRLTSPLRMDMDVKKGKLLIRNLSIPARKLSLLGNGSIGLDSSLNMKMNVVLGRLLSKKILRAQKKLKQAAGGILNRIGGGQVGNVVKSKLNGALGQFQVIPTDKKGRVIPIIGSIGSLSKVAHKFLGFEGFSNVAKSSDEKKSIDAKKLVDANVQKAKKAAQKALEDTKKKALFEANKAKKEAIKKANKAKELAKKRTEEAAQKARRKLEDKKKLLQKKGSKAVNNTLKKFGF